MMEFDEWCEATDEVVNGHDLKVLSGSADHLVDAHDKVAAIIPAHYASEEHVAHVLERLGKAAAAEFVRQKLPESKAIRSGDLGEILATEYISENTPYEVPIKRLRWNDHRNMAMRGDDVIGVLPIPLLSQAGQNTVRHVTCGFHIPRTRDCNTTLVVDYDLGAIKGVAGTDRCIYQ